MGTKTLGLSVQKMKYRTCMGEAGWRLVQDSAFLRAWSCALVGLLSAFPVSSAAAAQHPRRNPGSEFEHVHALAVDPQGRSILIGAHTGLFRSDDGGKSWKRANVSTKHSHLDVMAVAFAPKDSRIIYVGTHEAGVLKSSDGGATWAEVNNGLGGLDVHGLAVDPNAPAKLHAAVREKGEGIYRTTDGGGKWTRVDDGPSAEVKVLASVNVPTGMGGIYLYAGTSEGLQQSPDCF